MGTQKNHLNETVLLSTKTYAKFMGKKFAYLNLWDSCQYIEVLKALGGVDYTK